jgi:branched-chain amino acid transport system ATP-binding protein
MLELDNVHAYYGDSHVLRGISMSVAEGEVVGLLGRNGAGKTTTLLTIMGYVRCRDGTIAYKGARVDGFRPHLIARRGIGFVPQERRIFSSLTVRENLTVGEPRRGRGRWTLKDIFEIFPSLEARKKHLGSNLSGGEQQMLAIARALMLDPAMLLLDEPSEGLAPMIVDRIVQVLRDVKGKGLPILLIEQNLRTALQLADRHYILSKGEICYEGLSRELESDEAVKSRYLGVYDGDTVSGPAQSPA